MRKYGKIETAFWNNPKVRARTEDAQRLLLYFYSCPHGNALGCFALPTAYMTHDLNWTVERVNATLAELAGAGFVERDDKTDTVLIVGWFDHNAIENPNVARNVLASYAALPKSEIKDKVKTLLEGLTKPSETVRDVLAQGLRIPNLTLTEPEPKPGRSAPPSDAVLEKDFEEFYGAYPRKDDRGHARKAYAAVRRKGVDRETLLSGARRYAAAVSGTERKFIAMPTTWLNGERWRDAGVKVGSTNGVGGQWRARVTNFHRLGLWDDEWGPKPGAPGCKAPPEIVAELMPHGGNA